MVDDESSIRFLLRATFEADWAHLHSLKGWGSALLATVLWPLLLLGVNLHLHWPIPGG